MKDKQEPIWEIIKYGLRKFIQSETSSPGGILNLIFGILIFVIIFSTIIADPLEMVIKLFNPKVDIGLPWYVVLIMFICGIGYFMYCVKSIIKFDMLKNKINDNDLL